MLGRLHQESRGGELVEIADMVAMAVGNRDEADVAWLDADPGEVVDQFRFPPRGARRRGVPFGPVGERVRISGIPEQETALVTDQVAVPGIGDRLADIDAGSEQAPWPRRS
jgi:hypothetical protein